MTAISNTRYDHLRRDFAWRSMDFEVRQCGVIDELTEIDGTEHYGVYLQDHMHGVICAPMRANSSALLISDITSLGGNQYRFNFTGALDGSVVVGDFLHVKGATNEDNNGRYEIVSKGTAYAVVINANGAAQASGGTVVCAISYSPMIETQSAPSAGQYSPDYTSGSGVVRLNAARDTEYFVLQYEGGGTIDRVGVGGKGSGGGGGGTGINLLTNGDGETDLLGWTPYADAAGVEPIDGAGGSPNITWTLSALNPLRGAGSFLLTKDAANRQGQGVSYDVTVDNADKGQVIELRGEGRLVSGVYDSDIRVFVYDVTNANVIEFSPRDLESAGAAVPFTFKKSLQVPINATVLRICIHIASTSTSAFSMVFDTLEFGPVVRAYGSPITDPQDFGPITIGATTTPPTKGTVDLERALVSRYGAYAKISYEYVQTAGGAAGSGVYLFPMPAGLKIAHARASFRGDSGITYRGYLGHGWVTVDGSTGAGVTVRAYDADNLCLMTEDGAFYEASDSWLNFSNTIVRISFDAFVPIVGWSANAEMNSDYDTRLMTCRASGTPASASAGNPIIFPTVDFDSHGGYDAATGEYTAKFAGVIDITGWIDCSTANLRLAVFINGSQDTVIGGTGSTLTAGSIAGSIKVKADDVITVRPLASGTGAFVAGGFISFSRKTGASQVAASETISASAYVSANYAVNANEAIDFDTVLFDSHGMITPGSGNTWIATAPASGQYLISGNGKCAIATPGIQLYKNGSALSYVTVLQGNVPNSFAVLVDLKQGDTISLNSLSTTTIDGGSAPYVTQVSIIRCR